jgi:hypothetical protein
VTSALSISLVGTDGAQPCRHARRRQDGRLVPPTVPPAVPERALPACPLPAPFVPTPSLLGQTQAHAMGTATFQQPLSGFGTTMRYTIMYVQQRTALGHLLLLTDGVDSPSSLPAKATPRTSRASRKPAAPFPSTSVLATLTTAATASCGVRRCSSRWSSAETDVGLPLSCSCRADDFECVACPCKSRRSRDADMGRSSRSYGDVSSFYMDTRPHRTNEWLADDENKTMLGLEQKADLIAWLHKVGRRGQWFARLLEPFS